MGVDTTAMRWFQLVADGATVTEVAELEMVSQPGVSRALARLEEEVGAKLLVRSGRVLRLTRAGSAFKTHVDSVLHHYDDAVAAVAEMVDPETGVVALGFQLSFGTWLVPRLIASFREEHPRVRFVLEHAEDDPSSEALLSSRYDLEITSLRPTREGLAWEPLFSQNLSLAVPSEHRLARRRSVRLSTVADEEFVMLQPSWALRTLTDQLCAEAGFEPRISFECDDLQVVRGFVAAGLGVAVVPRGRATSGPPARSGSSRCSTPRPRASSVWRGRSSGGCSRPPSSSVPTRCGRRHPRAPERAAARPGADAGRGLRRGSAAGRRRTRRSCRGPR